MFPPPGSAVNSYRFNFLTNKLTELKTTCKSLGLSYANGSEIVRFLDANQISETQIFKGIKGEIARINIGHTKNTVKFIQQSL